MMGGTRNTLFEALSGDPRAINRVLGEVRCRALAIAVARVGDPDGAEDVAQAVLVKVVGGVRRLRSVDRFWPWVHRISVNESHNWNRRRRSEGHPSWEYLSTAERGCEDDLALAIDAERLRAVVSGICECLPRDQERAFRKVYFDGLRPSEVAEESGRRPVTIRASLCRARREVRRRIEEGWPGLAAELGASDVAGVAQ